MKFTDILRIAELVITVILVVHQSIESNGEELIESRM